MSNTRTYRYRTDAARQVGPGKYQLSPAIVAETPMLAGSGLLQGRIAGPTPIDIQSYLYGQGIGSAGTTEPATGLSMFSGSAVGGFDSINDDTPPTAPVVYPISWNLWNLGALVPTATISTNYAIPNKNTWVPTRPYNP
jgi:hypothetical protein